MTLDTRHGRMLLLRAAVITAVVGASTVGSYALTRAWKGESADEPSTAATRRAGAETLAKNPFVSGRHLVALVFLASDCGFSTEKWVKQAIRHLRDSLQASHSQTFANVSVVGVAIDDELGAGIRFLQDLGESGKVFDQIAVGGSWLNELSTRLMWRDGLATPAIPQVVLIERHVDASDYPGSIDVQRDSVLLTVTGRDDIIAWVNSGMPLSYRKSGKESATR